MAVKKSFLTVVVLILLLSGCARATPTVKKVVVYTTAEAIGTLVLEDHCLRLRTWGSNVYLVWPEIYRISVHDDVVTVHGPEGEMTLRIGQEVSVSGGAITSYTKIQELRKKGRIPPDCEGPYWGVGLDISPYVRLEGTLRKEKMCWYLDTNKGPTYTLVWTGMVRVEKERVIYGEFETQEDETVFVPKTTLQVGDRVHVEGALYLGRWRGGNIPSECPGPYLVVDSIRHVEER